MTHGVCEMLWLKQVLVELKRAIEAPMTFYCDNKATISIVMSISNTHFIPMFYLDFLYFYVK